MAGVDFTMDIGRAIGARLGDFGRLAGDAEDVLADARRSLHSDLISVWPVDTGTSLRNWENRIDGLVWYFRNPVEYVEWVFEAGTYSGPDSTPRIADWLEEQIERYASDVVSDLRRLLVVVRAESLQPRPFAPRPPSRPSAASIVGGAVFRAAFRGFQQPGRGARQRLRERFPNQPIGRAASRQRDRSRLR